MKSFGQIIREIRVAKNLSYDDLVFATKIKKSFLIAIEKEKWSTLPHYPVLQGFIRLIAHALEENENKLVAFLRRDYPPQKLRVIPKPDVADKFHWSPKLTFLSGLVVLVFLIAGYLAYQYVLFISPPKLVVNLPPEGFAARDVIVRVEGSTAQDAVVKVNNQPFIVDEKGNFSDEIEITRETTEIEIKAVSRSGKETVVKRNISLNLSK